MMRPPPTLDTAALAVLFRQARRRRGWSYDRLYAETGIARATLYRALTTGRCSSTSALRLCSALGIQLTLPPAPRVYTAQEAQHGG